MRGAYDVSSESTTGRLAGVLIIGTGASGGAAALRLSEAGFDVVCLDCARPGPSLSTDRLKMCSISEQD
jgi:cation diffusion facilitator CzcD-associated flavoprotein CzcO